MVWRKYNTIIFRDTFSPYTVLGLGGMNTSHNGEVVRVSLAKPALVLPMKLAITSWFVVMYAIVTTKISTLTCNQAQTNFMTWLLNLGFVVPFGPKPVAVVAEAPAPEPTPVAAPDCSTMDDDKTASIIAMICVLIRYLVFQSA